MSHPEWILTDVCHSDSSELLFLAFVISCSRLPSFSQKCHLSLPEKQRGLLWRHVLSQPWSRSQRGDHDNVTNLPGCVCRTMTPVLHVPSFLSTATVWPWLLFCPRVWHRTWASSGTQHPREVRNHTLTTQKFIYPPFHAEIQQMFAGCKQDILL